MKPLLTLAAHFRRLYLLATRSPETEVKTISDFFTMDEFLGVVLACEDVISNGSRLTQNDADVYKGICREYISQGYAKAPMTAERAAWLRRFAARK